MKLLVDAASDRVVGLHMVGAEAGEIVQGFAVAMKAGATKAVFDATLGIHPTAAEVRHHARAGRAAPAGLKGRGADMRQRSPGLQAVAGACNLAGLVPIASPMRILRAGAQSGLKASWPLGNSITTVEPSRKRPISSPACSAIGSSA